MFRWVRQRRLRRRVTPEGQRHLAAVPLAGPRPPRIALYSHDAMGLGHLRRNLLIAGSLARASSQPSVLLASGAAQVNLFRVPPGVDWISLPGLAKGPNGGYRPRSLALPLEGLIEVRAQALRAALEAFRPDVLIVDKLPRGLLGELEPALASLRARGEVACVLGLRDVLDDPRAVRREWSQLANGSAIERYYDAVFVYGDRSVYDLVRECRFPAGVARKVRFTGYLDRAQTAPGAPPHPAPGLDLPERFVLCTVGGGQDGARLAEAFSRVDLPAGVEGLLLTGPFMPPDERRLLVERAGRRLRVLEFAAEPLELLRRAERVISMGGYNTLSEILSLEKRALVVPRVAPRREQWIRARRLQDLGLVDLCHPHQATSCALGEWLDRDLAPPRDVRSRIDLNGLPRIAELLAELLGGSHGAPRAAEG